MIRAAIAFCLIYWVLSVNPAWRENFCEIAQKGLYMSEALE